MEDQVNTAPTPIVEDEVSSDSSSCSHESEKSTIIAKYDRNEEATHLMAVHTCDACGNKRYVDMGCL